MRQIKFRIWSSRSSRSSEMIYANPSNLNHSEEIPDTDNLRKALSIQLDGTIDSLSETHQAKDLTLMQFTGFTDIQEKDVYESDICQGKLSLGCMGGDLEHGTIVYNSNEARYELKSEASTVPLTMVDEIKVVGNIFETPNLLNDRS